MADKTESGPGKWDRKMFEFSHDLYGCASPAMVERVLRERLVPLLESVDKVVMLEPISDSLSPLVQLKMEREKWLTK